MTIPQESSLPELDCHLQPKQTRLYNLIRAQGPEVPTIIGFGGAKGGAKSKGFRNVALLMAAELATQYPGIAIAIVRRRFTDLNDTHIKRMWIEFPELADYYHAGDKELRLPNGARISFRYSDTTRDVEQQFKAGVEFAIIFLDQAEQFTEYEIQCIKTACRWPDTPNGFCKLVLGFNPGGPGNEYLRRVFVQRKYQDNERAGDFSFIQAYGWDNYYWFRGQVPISEDDFYQLPSRQRRQIFINETSYGRDMWQQPPSIRTGMLEGSFDAFEGQYFAGSWDRQACTLTESQVQRLVQTWWVRWMALDWGWGQKHWAVTTWGTTGAIGPQMAQDVLGIETQHTLDIVIVYRELVANQTPEEQYSQMMVDATPQREIPQIRSIFVGRDIRDNVNRFQEHSTEELLNPRLEQAGLPALEMANRDRIAGWRQMYEAFRRSSSLRSRNPPQDQPIGPLLFISEACPVGIDSIPILIADPDRPADVLKLEQVADDWGDSVRYMYHSYFDPTRTLPRDEQYKQVYSAYEDVTERQMAIMRFNAQQSSKGRVGSARRNR
jgi:hypothetical protein